MKNPLVTIAIPAYKRTFLSESIESALSQDYYNIELIIVDDNSPHNLKDIVNQFNDARIKYYKNDVNIGRKNPVANWNRCVELAQGDFFILLCDDDLLMPTFISSLLKLADKYMNCNVFHARRIIRNEITKKEIEDQPIPEWISAEEMYKSKYWHTITEFMYRTPHVKKLKYVSFPVAWGSDDVSIINFAAEGGIASASECLAVFRYNEEHISKNDTHMVEKAKARIENAMWFGQFFYDNEFAAEVINPLEILIIEFIKRVNIFNQFRILFYVPNKIWSWKHKCAIALHILKGEYKHPGYGYPGC